MCLILLNMRPGTRLKEAHTRSGVFPKKINTKHFYLDYLAFQGMHIYTHLPKTEMDLANK